MMPGMIMLWAGSVESIPTGWHLCDGTMGTPNLHAKYVRGASSTLAPHLTGGSMSHSHTLDTEIHSHTIPSGSDIEYGTGYAAETEDTYVVGVTDDVGHMPPYYTLCYIMKIN